MEVECDQLKNSILSYSILDGVPHWRYEELSIEQININLAKSRTPP